MLSSEMFLPKTLLSDQALARRQNFKTDFYVCIHEAGHVVAARYFGFQVAWVSYDTDFLQMTGSQLRTIARRAIR